MEPLRRVFRATSAPKEPCAVCGFMTMRLISIDLRMLKLCNKCFREIRLAPLSHLDESDTL